MTRQKETDGILDLLICPGFCVQNNVITQVNQAASAMLLTTGTDVRTLLCTGSEEYAAFAGGCLYLKLRLGTEEIGAAVTRKDDLDYFLLDQPSQDSVLQALALAAKELRSTMTGTIISAEQISHYVDKEDSEANEQLARLNRGLHRTLRLIGNMSDARDWPASSRQEIRNIDQVFGEIFEKTRTLAELSGVTLTYEGLSETVYTLADQAQLERAVLNILSNALKFTPEGGTIQAILSRRGRTLRLSIQDSGCGIQENIRGTLFSRYLRQPGMDDSRFGLGLGMVIVRSAAAAHGGTVLIDQPEPRGTRVTITMTIRQDTGSKLLSPILGLDYAGERDRALLELSDCLPLEPYQK